MIHTPLTKLIEFAAAIPRMVAPNVLPRGQPMPRKPVTGAVPNRTEKAGVWASKRPSPPWAATKPSRAGGLKTPAKLTGDREWIKT